MKSTQKPLVTAALVGLIVSSVAAFTDWFLIADMLFPISDSEIPAQELSVLTVISQVAVIFGSAALAIMGFFTKSLSSLRIPSLVLFFSGFGLWLAAPIPYVFESLQEVTQDPIFFLKTFYFPPDAGSLTTGVYLSAVSSIVLFLNANDQTAGRVETQLAQSTSENSSYPNSSQQPMSASKSPLPLLALVLAFFFPVISIVLGHVALNQMKRGQIASDQRGLAIAGLVLGYAFTAWDAVLLGSFALGFLNFFSSVGYSY